MTDPKRPVQGQAVNFSEAQGIRYLHFGTPWIQGAMRLRNPHELVLDYTQDMMAWLMLLRPPKRMLQLGLGAGACARFLSHHFLESKQTVVELHCEVILANAVMFHTRAHQGLKIVHDDAKRYLKLSKPEACSLLLVDLYDADALGPSCDGLGFYRSCYRVLQSPGLMVANLFGSHPSWAPNLEAMTQAFKTVPLALAPGRAGNVVVIAAKGPSLKWPANRCAAELDAYLYKRATLLSKALKLPAKRWIDPMRSYLRASG